MKPPGSPPNAECINGFQNILLMNVLTVLPYINPPVVYDSFVRELLYTMFMQLTEIL